LLARPAPGGTRLPAAGSLAGATVASVAPAGQTRAETPATGPGAGAPSSGGGRTRAKPPVRRLAKDLGIDIDSVVGTGPGGIVTREDVVAHHERSDVQLLANWTEEEPWLEGGSVSPDGRRTRVPARSVRRRTAEAMVHSAFTAPHVTEFQTVDVTRTMELVTRLKADREFSGLHVTPLLVAMRALLLAVNRHPEINASWDDETNEIVYKHYVNLGIAAATPRGLVVPNIKDAHRLNLKELAEQLGELTSTARAGKTQPAQMADGTITITNVGAFGIDTGTPILNPGESAILAFGAVRQQPWVHDGEIQVRWITQLALSFDHRLVDGALGSYVLRDVATVLEDPSVALVWA
ncbi:MAG: dihydrolipoamide acetyltransferase family protein, partial [Actinomycetaceae bacterium]